MAPDLFFCAVRRLRQCLHPILFRRISLLLLLCFFSAPTPARALRFDVFPGYGDVVPESSWFPIVFELRNDGPTFNATIEVAAGGFGGNQVRQVLLELPTGTTKRVVVPVFSTSRDVSWICRLLDERGKIRAETEFAPRQQKIRQPRAGTPIIGSLSRTISGVPIVPPIKSLEIELQPVVGRLQPALFPDNPISLEGLHLLYLNSSTALELKAPQVQALMMWLHEGGHLVVAVEQLTDINGAPWLRSLLPCDFNATAMAQPGREFQAWFNTYLEPAVAAVRRSRREAGPSSVTARTNVYTELPDDAAFERANLPIVTGNLIDAKVRVGNAGQPLMMEAPRGRGRLTVLTFSPEREPFLSWKNRSWFWARLAEASPELYQNKEWDRTAGMSSDGIFGTLIDSRQVRKLPLGWLLLLLLVYLLVIGPLDHYGLKKINRQMLTWITFPCYVVFFSLLIYFIGFKLRAGDSEFNELDVVDVMPVGGEALLRGHTYVSIYSPSNQKYPLQGDQLFSTLRGEYFGNLGRGEGSGGRIRQRGNQFDAEVFVPVWTSQLYVSDWMQPGNAPLMWSVSRERSTWKIDVTNRIDRPVTPLRLCVSGRVHDLGEIPGHQTKSFTVNANSGMAVRDFAQSNGSSFLAAVQRRRNTFGSDDHELSSNPANAAMAASFLRFVAHGEDSYQSFVSPPGLDLTPFAGNQHAVLLGYVADYSMTGPFHRFTPRRSKQNTLLRLVLALP